MVSATIDKMRYVVSIRAPSLVPESRLGHRLGARVGAACRRAQKNPLPTRWRGRGKVANKLDTALKRATILLISSIGEVVQVRHTLAIRALLSRLPEEER